MFPNSVVTGQLFTLNGTNFMLNSQSQIQAVLIGQFSVSYQVNSDTQITTTVPFSNKGQYDISIVTTGNITLTLPQALQVR